MIGRTHSMTPPLRIPLVLALFLFPLFLIYCASLAPVGSSSEAREVHIAQIMYETGDWILPKRNGILPSKPPLYHWLVASCGILFGQVNEAIARAVSILSATIMLIAVMRTAGSLYKSSPSSAALAQGIAGVILSSSYLFLLLATNCRVDMVFATCTTLALLVSYRNILEHRFHFSSWLLFWIWCGFAVLAKGPLGLALPLFVTTLFAFADKLYLQPWRNKSGLFLHILLGIGIVGAISAPWYILASYQGGQGFITKQLLFENIKRVSGGAHINTEKWYYYGPAFFRSLFPWSLLYLYTFIHPGDSLRPHKKLRFSSPESKAQYLANIWVIGVLTIFTFASGKRASYLLPLIPAMVLACSIFLTEILRRKSLPSYLKQTQIKICVGNAMLTFFCASAIATIIYTTDSYYLVSPRHYLIKSSLLHYLPSFAWVFGVGALLVTIGRFAPTAQRASIVMLLYGGTWVGLITLLNLGITIKNDLKNFKEQARTINSVVTQPDAQLYVVRKYREEYFDPIMLYLHRPLKLIYPKKFSSTNFDTTKDNYIIGFDDKLKTQLDSNILFEKIISTAPPIDLPKHVTTRKISVWRLLNHKIQE